ncbi:Uncharacterized protein Fot_12586 [Forsythia ovata]|uniref:Uncharacterized protein n=1 Tax=Forsythia ovata TaxID=205694 RepID=A0ABD1WMZ5_9LAMI
MGLLADPVGSVHRVAQIRCDLRGRGAWLTGGVDPPELRGGRSRRSHWFSLVVFEFCDMVDFLRWFLSFVTWWIGRDGEEMEGRDGEVSAGYCWPEMLGWLRRWRWRWWLPPFTMLGCLAG